MTAPAAPAIRLYMSMSLDGSVVGRQDSTPPTWPAASSIKRHHGRVPRLGEMDRHIRRTYRGRHVIGGVGVAVACAAVGEA
jgi:hypothetical protein